MTQILSENTPEAAHIIAADGVLRVQTSLVHDADRYDLVVPGENGEARVLGTASGPVFSVPVDGLGSTVQQWAAQGQVAVVAYKAGQQVSVSFVSYGDPNAKADMNAYLASLTSWENLWPQKKDDSQPVGQPKSAPEKGGKGWVRKTGQTYSLTRTPGKIVTFNPNAGALWPGAIVQGMSAANNGILDELPIAERQKLSVKVDVLHVKPGSMEVKKPSGTSVRDALSEIVRGQSLGPTNVVYQMRELHSVEESALKLGLSARYLGAKVTSKLERKSKVEYHSVLAYFEERAFTASATVPSTPNDWFTDAFTNKQLDYLKQVGSIGSTNPPLYVSSVTYGRVLLFSCTSTSSVEQISAALTASYEFGKGGVEGEVSKEHRKLLSESQVSVVAVGGDPASITALIKSCKIADYFKNMPKLDQYQPMSFVLNQLTNNRLAQLSETTSYTEHTYSPMAFTVTCDILDVKLSTPGVEFVYPFRVKLDGAAVEGKWNGGLGGWDLPKGALAATRDFGPNPAVDTAFSVSPETKVVDWQPSGSAIAIVPDPAKMVGTRGYEATAVQPWGDKRLTIRYRLSMIQPPATEWPGA